MNDIGINIPEEDNTRERILRTAGPIFAQRGFRDATVREICDQADVNLASVNYYFGDKAKLYSEVIQFARASNDLAQNPVRDAFQLDSPEEQLFAFVRAMLRHLGVGDSPSWQTQLLVNEFLSPGLESRELVEERFRPNFENLLKLLQHFCPEQLPREQLLRCGFSLIGQCLHYRVAEPLLAMFIPDEPLADLPLRQLARHITDFTIAAMTGLRAVEAENGESSQSTEPSITG